MSKKDKKEQSGQKGLTDKELIKKYESGKIPLKKIVSSMMKTPPPRSGDTPKR